MQCRTENTRVLQTHIQVISCHICISLMLLTGVTHAKRHKKNRIFKQLSKRKIRWQTLQRGIAYTEILLGTQSRYGDNRFKIVRVDPAQVSFRILLAKRHGNTKRTAKQWVAQFRLAVAVNMGMFQMDHRTHVGFMRYGNKIESRKWRRNYLSMLVVGPRRKGLPKAQILDLDNPKSKRLRKQYRIAIQNLRLIKRVGRRGRSVWKKKRKRWSEMALAMDRKGKLLFVYSRTPYSMWQFNRMLLALPLGVVRAMHLEGGPEASMSLDTKTRKTHENGSYETGFQEHDREKKQWPLPNVIGIARRK